MTETPQAQIQSDIAADQVALTDLNEASTVAADSRLSSKEKAEVHTDLAKESGVINAQEALDKAWEAGNPAASTTVPPPTAPVVTPPVVTPPVVVPTPPAPTPSSSRVPMMSQFAGYKIAPGGDFEFAEMPTTAPGVIPAGWVLSPSSQISGPSVATDVQVVNGEGLILTCSDVNSGAGGSIETKGVGFEVLGQFYREIEATIPPLVNGQTVNQIGLWMLTLSNNGEIDLVITGWGNISENMETGPQSQYAAHGPNYIVNGAYVTGKHRFGVSWDNNPAHGVQSYLDSAAVGSPVPWPSGHQPDTNSPWFLALTNQGASPAGINGATGKTVAGAAGQVVIAYDCTFVPA